MYFEKCNKISCILLDVTAISKQREIEERNVDERRKPKKRKKIRQKEKPRTDEKMKEEGRDVRSLFIKLIRDIAEGRTE